MCLYTNDQERIAETDIICYKVLKKKCLFGIDFFFTPIRNRYVSRSILKGRRKMKARGKKIIYASTLSYFSDNIFKYKITKGFIHTFSFYSYLLVDSSEDEKIFKCIIPKGTRYYKSDHGKEYASESIVFIKEIF